MGKQVQGKTVTFSERAFLKKLGLDSFIGLKGICINGRFLTTIEDVKSIDIVVWELVDTENYFYKED